MSQHRGGGTGNADSLVVHEGLLRLSIRTRTDGSIVSLLDTRVCALSQRETNENDRLVIVIVAVGKSRIDTSNLSPIRDYGLKVREAQQRIAQRLNLQRCRASLSLDNLPDATSGVNANDANNTAYFKRRV